MKTRIFRLNDINREKWNKLVTEQSLVWQTYEWGLANKSINNEPLFIIAEKNHEWMGGWMVFQNAIKLLPSFLSIGIHIPCEPLVRGGRGEGIIIEKLWQEIEGIRPLEVIWLNYVGSRWKNREFLLNKNFSSIMDYGSYIIELSKSDDELWKNIHSKHRNVIRRSEKEGIRVDESDDIESFFRLSEDTYRRSGGRGPSYKNLKEVYRCLRPSGLCRLFFSTHEEQHVSGAFMLLCGKRVIYWHGATCDNPPTGSSNLLHWEMIRKFKAEGYHWYDFGGASLNPESESKSRGINRFKEQFGGKLEIYCGGYKINSVIRRKIRKIIIDPLLKISKYIYRRFDR